jgi:hypothetical protein
MTRAGKLILVAFMLLVAVWLHLTHCAWRFPNSTLLSEFPVWATDKYVQVNRGPNSPSERVCIGSGLFARVGCSTSEASVWGVAVPGAIVVGTLVLSLRWRQQGRVVRGACAACGHQLLRGTEICSECGAPVTPA